MKTTISSEELYNTRKPFHLMSEAELVAVASLDWRGEPDSDYVSALIMMSVPAVHKALASRAFIYESSTYLEACVLKWKNSAESWDALIDVICHAYGGLTPGSLKLLQYCSVSQPKLMSSVIRSEWLSPKMWVEILIGLKGNPLNPMYDDITSALLERSEIISSDYIVKLREEPVDTRFRVFPFLLCNEELADDVLDALFCGAEEIKVLLEMVKSVVRYQFTQSRVNEILISVSRNMASEDAIYAENCLYAVARKHKLSASDYALMFNHAPDERSAEDLMGFVPEEMFTEIASLLLSDTSQELSLLPKMFLDKLIVLASGTLSR